MTDRYLFRGKKVFIDELKEWVIGQNRGVEMEIVGNILDNPELLEGMGP